MKKKKKVQVNEKQNKWYSNNNNKKRKKEEEAEQETKVITELNQAPITGRGKKEEVSNGWYNSVLSRDSVSDFFHVTV